MAAIYWRGIRALRGRVLLMNKKTFACLAAIVVSVLPAWAQVQPAVLTIHVDQPISKVSPTLYGLMTEEINYSYDGGLYAEMVRNRTFRSRRQDVPHWLLVEDGTAEAKMAPDPQTGPSEALPTSLRLEVIQADRENPAGVLNDGYWGMPFDRTPPTKVRSTPRWTLRPWAQ